MATLWVVFADYRFAGLYRSLPAAQRLKKELEALPVNWGQEPTIQNIKDVVEGLSCHVASYQYLSDAIECEWYGRSKYAI